MLFIANLSIQIGTNWKVEIEAVVLVRLAWMLCLIYLLFWFLSLKDSFFLNYEKCFHFTSKAVFVLEIFKLEYQFHDAIKASWLYWTCKSKTCQICQNQHADFLRFLFTEDTLQIKKDLGLVSRLHLLQNFLIRTCLLKYYINWPGFITRLCLLPKLSSKMYFLFHA